MSTKGTALDKRRSSISKSFGKSVKKIVKNSSFSSNSAPKKSNRNSDLHALGVQFDEVKVKLEQFIKALKEQHLALQQINKTRLSVAESIAALASNSPLSQHAGSISGAKRGSVKTKKVTTYLDVHQKLSVRQKAHTEVLMERLIQYAEEWHVISDRKVSASLRRTNKLRKDVDHYEAKVHRVNFDKNRIAKGGTSSDAYLHCCEKLERNEEKLHSSNDIYNEANKETTALIEELTKRSWKDLFPAFFKLAELDASLASDENKLLKRLTTVSECLKEVKATHKLIPESTRLQNIENFESIYRLNHLQHSWNKVADIEDSDSDFSHDEEREERKQDKLDGDLDWSKNVREDNSRGDRIMSARTVSFRVQPETDSIKVKANGVSESDTQENSCSDESSLEEIMGAQTPSSSDSRPPSGKNNQTMLV